MRKYLFTIWILCLPAALSAQFRKYSNEFLNIGAGARGLGMGAAQVASVADGTAGYWNPAALVAVQDTPVIHLMHASYFDNIGKYDYASFSLPLAGSRRVIGFSVLRFGVDDIPNTLFLVEPDGSINYNNITTFSSADYAFLLSFAQKIRDEENYKTSFGANVKVIHRKVGHFATAWGFGLDAAFRMRLNQWSFGVVARDVTTTFNAWRFQFTEREKEIFYLTQNDISVKSTEMTAPALLLGAAHTWQVSNGFSLLAEANARLTFDGRRNTLLSSDALSIDPHVGLEAAIQNTFFVRAGIHNFQQALADSDTLNQKKVWIYQPSLGAGFRLNTVVIDYAFSNLANQSNPLYTHIFSLKIQLNPKDDR